MHEGDIQDHWTRAVYNIYIYITALALGPRVPDLGTARGGPGTRAGRASSMLAQYRRSSRRGSGQGSGRGSRPGAARHAQRARQRAKQQHATAKLARGTAQAQAQRAEHMQPGGDKPHLLATYIACKFTRAAAGRRRRYTHARAALRPRARCAAALPWLPEAPGAAGPAVAGRMASMPAVLIITSTAAAAARLLQSAQCHGHQHTRGSATWRTVRVP